MTKNNSVKQSKNNSGNLTLLSDYEVAEILGVDRQTVQRLARDGYLPKVKIRSSVRYKYSDVELLVEQCTET